MSDLIDRQAAIAAIEFDITYVKAINKETGEVTELFKKENEALEKAAERIKQLPSVQLDTYWKEQCQSYEQTINKLRESLSTQREIKQQAINSSDCIDRRAAIDALRDWEMCYDWDEHCREEPKAPWVVSPSGVINKLPSAEPHWIPCSERLPELRHDVLLTVFFHEKWNVTEGYRHDGEFMFWNHGRLDSVLDEENRVIAWMPKPEPYKVVTE